MRVALLGAKGQLGTDLWLTRPSAWEVVPLGRSELDVTSRSQVLEVLGSLKPQIILNTTAYVKVDAAEENPEEAFAVNAAGVKNLADAACDLGAILVHFSTDYVFDGAKGRQRTPYTEEDPPRPLNLYGLSKYAGELIVQNYLSRYYLVRVASLYGRAGARGKGGNFVYTILKKARAGEKLKVVNDIYMSPTYTLDAARQVWRLLLEGYPFGTYHVTNAGYCTWYEFAIHILRYAGLEAEIEPVKHTAFPAKARRPGWSPLASVKGLRLRSWQEALKDFMTQIQHA